MVQDGHKQSLGWVDAFREVTEEQVRGGGGDLGQDRAEVRLADNTPVWHAFLPDPDAMVVDRVTEQNARTRARACLQACELKDSNVGALIQGKSPQEARRILEEIEKSSKKAEA